MDKGYHRSSGGRNRIKKAIPIFGYGFFYIRCSKTAKKTHYIFRNIRQGVKNMKKVFLFLIAAAMAFSFAGCREDEISCGEEYEEPIPEISSSETGEEEEKTEIDYEWEDFVEEMSISSITEEDLEKLLEWGLSREEIMEMFPAFIQLELRIMEQGVEKEDLLVSSGTSGTIGAEFIEEFILAVEKNEAASVSGTMMGYTFPYYFELSFEPGGLINLLQVSPHGSDFSGSLSEIYDAETFYYFSGDDGNYFSVPKIKLYTEERFQTEPGEDIEGASVSAKEAAKEAKKALLFAKGSDFGFYWEKKSACFGSYGHIIVSGDMEKADEYYKNLSPMVTGHAVLEGEYYYMVSMFEGEIDTGSSYAVSAEKPFGVFSISEVDGSFHPIAYDIEPRVDLDAFK